MKILIWLLLLTVSTMAADLRTQKGNASFYWQPQKVACPQIVNGKRIYPQFNPDKLTAAHKTLPCGTNVTVTNLLNGLTVGVTINDRGPFVRGRIIDLSREAAKRIEMTGRGVVPVEIRW